MNKIIDNDLVIKFFEDMLVDNFIETDRLQRFTNLVSQFEEHSKLAKQFVLAKLHLEQEIEWQKWIEEQIKEFGGTQKHIELAKQEADTKITAKQDELFRYSNLQENK